MLAGLGSACARSPAPSAAAAADDWSGRYRTDLAHSNAVLELRESRFVHRMSTCAGPIESEGRVEDRGDHALLRPTADEHGFVPPALRDPLWWKVRWGPYRFLVPDASLPDFCSDALDRFPLGRSAYLRDDPAWDVGRLPAGGPDVPEPYRGHLAALPIVTSVQAVLDQPGGQVLELDAGTGEGVLVGSRFWLGGPRGSAVVTDVDESRSRAVVRWAFEPIRVGTPATTSFGRRHSRPEKSTQSE